MKTRQVLARIRRYARRGILSAVCMLLSGSGAAAQVITAFPVPEERLGELMEWGRRLSVFPGHSLSLDISRKGYLTFTAAPDLGKGNFSDDRTCYYVRCYARGLCQGDQHVTIDEPCCDYQACMLLINQCWTYGVTHGTTGHQLCPVPARLYFPSPAFSAIKDPRTWIDTLLRLMGELHYQPREEVTVTFERAHSGEFSIRRVSFWQRPHLPELRAAGFQNEPNYGTFRLSNGRYTPDLPLQGYTLPDWLIWAPGKEYTLTYAPPREKLKAASPPWEVQVHPNPSKADIHVRIEGMESGWLRLYRDSGQEQPIEQPVQSGIHTVTLPQSGRYWLVIGDREGRRKSYLLIRE